MAYHIAFDMIDTTDNSTSRTPLEQEDLEHLQALSGKTIETLAQAHPNFVVFPSDLDKNLKQKTIFTIDNMHRLVTENIMGFIGCNGAHVRIRSRFTENTAAGKDYFLYYMLYKVFALRLFDLKTSAGQDDMWDFLIYLFPYYLRKAMRQGLFKQYKKFHYNDARFKSGAIDVARHIAKNPFFNGNIAYAKREFSADNPLTQLIRHTIEYVSTHTQFANSLLYHDSEIKDFVYQIITATPTYNIRQRQKVLLKNSKPVRHPYFTEYDALQKMCVRILRQEKISYGSDNDEVYGILFDGAWLWEAYLDTLLSKQGFIHPDNNKKSHPIYLFGEDGKRGKYPRYPDFYRKDVPVVFDAKYKKSDEHKDIVRDDVHQMISYMHVLSAKVGGLMYPRLSENEKTDTRYTEEGILKGYDGKIFKIFFNIPKESTDISTFKTAMEAQEKKFSDAMKELSGDIAS